MRGIEANGLTIHLRPRKLEKSNTTSAEVTVLELLQPTAQTTAGPPNDTTSGSSFWYDSLSCAGRLEWDEFTQISAAAGSCPFEVTSHMRGDRSLPTRDLNVRIGDQAAHGELTAQLTMEPTTQGNRITVQHLAAHGIEGTVTDAFLKDVFAKGPEALQQTFNAQLESLEASGSLERSAAGNALKGQVQIRGINISSQTGAKHEFHLKNLNLEATVETPSGGDFLQTGRVNHSQLSFDSMTYGKSAFQTFSTPVEVANGVLTAGAVKVSFAHGDFAGSIRASLPQRKLQTVALTVAHLDQKEVAANLAPDKLDAEGTTSGTIDLATDATGTLTGTIDLLGDGPGRLKIKDEKAADAFAQKLETRNRGRRSTRQLQHHRCATVAGLPLQDRPHPGGRARWSARRHPELCPRSDQDRRSWLWNQNYDRRAAGAGKLHDPTSGVGDCLGREDYRRGPRTGHRV